MTHYGSGGEHLQFTACRQPGLDARDSAFRFDADAIVDGVANALLTAQITLRGLDGDVTEKELYLLQFSTSRVAEPSARSATMPHSA